ncbi:MAG: polysulfide reductase NrfD [Acidimicrobiia bacterium]|jgi:Fe-S-cluster-containing dehydrogenase component/formate-dependent nitrite reductase membrane component NrfD|nr:polysulfide reductase NrfD [Acidimicrobiia bacterium]
MARFGFLIDQDTCIGCHACTVACKAEHDVPLGVNRTWVKYIEKGSFPDSQRKFSVMRCNHCDNAPCVTICPTNALFVRDDGIVDFDTSVCIGCKSCMNACPYDALYIDPEEHTAQKCNFCAHRIDVGLEPSCVIVCPTQSIVAGDLDDPDTRISKMVARHDIQVRAPEQGTRPKVFYKGADEASLDPTRTRIADDGMIWADTTPHHPTVTTIPVHLRPHVDDRGKARGGQVVARTVYTTEHPMPWKSMVTAYLVTKAIGAGALMVAALLVLLGHAGRQGAVGVLPPVLAGILTFVTGALLVADLKQPRRFFYLLTRPNWRSWLTRGAVILAIYAAISAAWFVAGLLHEAGAIRVLAAPGFVLGAATAGYTAYLFGQCEGRDLWQTPMLLPVLLAQAVVAGASAFLIADVFLTVPELDAIRWTLLGAIGAVAVFTFAELTARGTAHVEMAVAEMTRGRYAARFWLGGVLLGLVVPGALVVVALAAGSGGVALSAAAAAFAIVGLAAYEDAFVRAGQSVPLS